MKYSELFGKTLREAPKNAESLNHRLLVRAGFIDQLMAGSWSLLPLGLRVVSKVNNIIRDELNKTGAQEISLPLLHSRDVWDQTGRWADPSVKEIMYQFKDKNGKEFGLSFTHEEIVMDILRKYVSSYRDLPVKVYQFSTKFRNELRAKSGILRGREFLMKDLYSAHVSEADMEKYYEEVKKVYVKIFERMGLSVIVAEASGGVFTEKHSHEFQVPTLVGEDTIFYCEKCGFAQNKEVFEGGKKCPNCGAEIKTTNAIEVGNIFPLGTKYSRDMKAFYKDEKGEEKEIWFASYGIGPTRVMGTIVEVSNDEKGIIWPKSVSPFDVHLISISGGGEKVYKELVQKGVDVLFDDRDVSPGQKFADADLIGIPVRLVVSEKVGEGKVEVKERTSEESKIIPLEKLEI